MGLAPMWSFFQVVAPDYSCGDGVCLQPWEYPGFGRFGCAFDCGSFPNVSSLTVSFSTSFATRTDMDAASWNLCMMHPTTLCW